MLRRRGLDRASIDDVVQEVALRALAHRVTYASATDLLRWASPVACNLHVDLLRQRARLLDDPAAAERPASDDVAREVTHRIELQKALRGIAKLRPADREAILGAVAAEPAAPRTRQEAVRLAVRRHRARSRLALVMEQLAAWVTGLAWVRRGRRVAVASAMVPAAALPLVVGWRLMPAEPARVPARPAAVAPVVPAAAPVPVVLEGVAREVAPVATVSRRAAPAAARRTVAAVRGERGDGRSPKVALDAPGGFAAEMGTEPRPEDAHTVCVNDLPAVPFDVCV
jgi:DNA-directed RNA polymerase specialized sigma24 family protein